MVDVASNVLEEHYLGDGIYDMSNVIAAMYIVMKEYAS